MPEPDGLIQAEDHMNEVADGADMAQMMDTLVKFEHKYAHNQAWISLRSKWYTLHMETKTTRGETLTACPT